MTSHVRSKFCHVVGYDGQCPSCKRVEQVLLARAALKVEDIHPKCPLSSIPIPTLQMLVKKERSEKRAVQVKLDELTRKIDCESVPVSEDLHASLMQVMEHHKSIGASFTDVFWTQQKKALEQKNSKGMRWHPTMIRFAIYLHSKSAAAYNALRDMSVLKLPGETTLRDYTNVFPAVEGVQMHVLGALKKRVGALPKKEAYVALLHDEMTIRSDLVYDQKVGKVVGFVNPESC